MKHHVETPNPYSKRLEGSFQISYQTGLLLVIGIILIFFTALWCGYYLANLKIANNAQVGPIEVMPQAPAPMDQLTEEHLRVLTQHIGRIEANLMRINALGERLVLSARLDPQEFDFSNDVPVGGTFMRDNTPEELMATINQLSAMLDKRYAQLITLHQTLQMHWGQLELSFTGIGKAVTNGWISSFYGPRYDPFTGRKAWHGGVDIAGKEGAEIKALAAGIVTFADSKGGYGQFIEIKHSNGLTTRYGHNKELLVKQGQVVRKGQTISLLGSSGRSTGPHLHLEVHKNGQAVDPGDYFPDFKRNKST